MGKPVAQGETKTIRTMCPMSCHPTLCGMLVDVRDGELVGVRGDEANPDSAGFLCVRGKASREIIGNPLRLLHPLMRDRREEGAWRRATWDEALARIVSQMHAVGREAVGIWPGHGVFTTNYGTRLSGQLLGRFANLYGCQTWSPQMICWGLGAFGLGLTGVLETNTKEDLGAHAELIVLWAANLASQPNTARYVIQAKRRGAHIVVVDVRQSEACAHANEVLTIRPGTDTALALAMMHVIVGNSLHDADYVARHTTGFERLVPHLAAFTPAWAAGITGIAAERIEALARRYATTHPAMIVMGGSSLHKGGNGWHAARAIGCLPALTGNLGVAGAGFGPRHGSASHGQGLANLRLPERRPPGTYLPNQMSEVTAALNDGRVKVMMLLGTDMLSSYPDAERVAAGLAETELVVSYDLFLNNTARRYADIVLPGTAWLEELGCKMTNTHLYLMEPALEPPDETRSLSQLLQALAHRLGVTDFFPWASDAEFINAVLDHPATGRATVAALRAEGGIRALNVSPVGHVTHRFDTPSGKVEFYSERAEALGLPPLPVPREVDGSNDPLVPDPYPLALCHGRTLAHFHGFFDHGRALPTLAKHDPEPVLWIAPADAAERQIHPGARIRIFNQRGSFEAKALVTDKVPSGVTWMRDGWAGLNSLTSGQPILPDAAVDLFSFSAGQSTFDTMINVAAV
jgi:anaerobic selenocysteine-containing dehydrogenase